LSNWDCRCEPSTRLVDVLESTSQDIHSHTPLRQQERWGKRVPNPNCIYFLQGFETLPQH
jgi:hypothetical protein